MQHHEVRSLPNKGSRPPARVRYIFRGIINNAVILCFIVHETKVVLNEYFKIYSDITMPRPISCTKLPLLCDNMGNDKEEDANLDK